MSEDPYDWLIVGGGIHGVHLAVRLLAHGGVSPQRLRILDPAPRLLQTWRQCSANTGMRHLRSPAVHHLDLEPWSLLRFAGANAHGRGAVEGSFAPPYNRPSVALFERHCDNVIARHGLTDLHIQDRVDQIRLGRQHADVRLESGVAVRSRRILLALGASNQPRWPRWAQRLRADGHRVQHVFKRGFDLRPEGWPGRVAVVGSGISGAQVALRLAEAGRKVYLVVRRELRRHQFDSDPGWIGPKKMARFSATVSMEQRREWITRARHQGSLSPEVHRALRRAVRRGDVTLLRGESYAQAVDGAVILRVAETYVAVDGVLLATGFEASRPGGALVDDLIEAHGLPCAACGYPILDTHLQWHPALHVSGPLAELQVGPVARNIVGARRAAERILPVVRAGR